MCRCTGYVRIIEAIELLASGEPIPDTPLPKRIGDSGVKYEAEELALGDRGYVGDMTVPGMLHGIVRLADHARADVVKIDTAPAKAIPGVVDVFTAADIPGDLRVGIIYKDWPIFIPEGGRTSYLGDVMAIVVAEDQLTATKAAEAIEIEYNVLEPITDPVAAIADGVEDAVWELDGNVLSISEYTRGDFDAAYAASAHQVHEVFQTQRIEHAFLEPESTLAVPQEDGTLYVYSGGQGVWDDRDQIADVLSIEKDQVTVELVSNGGAFGGKEDMSNQAQTALAAWLLKQPVRCTFTREQSFFVHAKRHPIRIESWAACDAEGKLTALKARMVGDSGPYASVGMKVLERAAGHASGPYVVPNIDVHAVAARTNNAVAGAFRGFGANQAQFAMEGMVDRLADLVGIDSWEMRNRNAIEPGVVWGPGQIMDDGSAGIRMCLDAIKPRFDQAMADGKAVGLGLGLKNSGLGNGFLEIAKAVVRFNDDDTVEVGTVGPRWARASTRSHLQVAAEELDISPERIRVIVDTTRELGAGQTTGSRGTLMGAGSVQAACQAANADGRKIGVDYEGEYRVDWTNKLGDGAENPILHSAFGYAAQLVIADPETGEIEKLIAVHDVGRAVNPALCEGQVEGAAHMGLGYALTEDFPYDEDARPINMTLRSLGILRPKDMPEIEAVLVEAPQPRSPYGIKGVGEIGLVPTAGAVARALQQVDGTYRTQLPINKHQPVNGD